MHTEVKRFKLRKLCGVVERWRFRTGGVGCDQPKCSKYEKAIYVAQMKTKPKLKYERDI